MHVFMYVMFVKNEGEGKGGRGLIERGAYLRGRPGAYALMGSWGGLIEDLRYIFFVLCLLLHCPL